MDELSKWIVENHLKQADAAEILKISRPRVSDVVNKKVCKFTIDALVDMLSRIESGYELANQGLASGIVLSPATETLRRNSDSKYAQGDVEGMCGLLMKLEIVRVAMKKN